MKTRANNAHLKSLLAYSDQRVGVGTGFVNITSAFALSKEHAIASWPVLEAIPRSLPFRIDPKSPLVAARAVMTWEPLDPGR